MGLFGKKIVLKREYFESCFNLDKDAICRLRMNQGFNVSKGMDGGAVEIHAEMKHFIGFFKIVNRIHVFGNRKECEFNFYETFSLQEIDSFLRQNFAQVPSNVAYTDRDGIKRYAYSAYYLPDGNILARKNIINVSWFSLYIVPKDKIIK